MSDFNKDNKYQYSIRYFADKMYHDVTVLEVDERGLVVNEVKVHILSKHYLEQINLFKVNARTNPMFLRGILRDREDGDMILLGIQVSSI